MARLPARLTILVAALVAATSLVAQQPTVREIAPRYHLVASPVGNLVVYAGEQSSLVAGVHAPELVARARQLIASLGAPPVRYAVLMESDSAPSYFDAGWAALGVTTIAHEMLHVRMRILRSEPPAKGQPAWRGDMPMLGFSRVVQLFMREEEPHLVHDRNGATDADVIIHFEAAGLLMLGEIFNSDGYPRIAKERGGNVTALIKWLDWFCDNFDAPKLEPIVPGRGPVATFDELKAYRVMLRTVHDRVLALRDSGRTVTDVVSAEPTKDFDARWGRGPVSAGDFVRSVYATLPPKAGAP